MSEASPSRTSPRNDVDESGSQFRKVFSFADGILCPS